MDCSARLFRKKGYAATSMRDIAAAMDMEAASLYNHISSKQEILHELLMEMATRFTEGMAQTTRETQNAYSKLEQLVCLHVRLTLEHPDQISLITGEWVHLEEPALSAYLQSRNNYEQQFRRILLDARDEGSITCEDPDVALFSVLSTLHWLYSWYNRHREISAEALEKQMIHCLLEGLKVRGK